MARKKALDRPEKVRTTLEEWEMLMSLKESVEWAILKRMIERYRLQLRKISFNLPSDHSSVSHRHAELGGQDLGLRWIIKLVDKADREYEKRQKKKS